ncbi:MAG: pyridoxamine 5'-phosphate oxidase family protein [Candidatus Thorarchaeota archaeon]
MSHLIIPVNPLTTMKKAYPERMPLSEVWPLFEAGGLIHLSTLDGNQPRVRMMSFTVHDQKLWIATRTGDDKVSQIRKNSNVEFTLAVQGKERTGCLRTTAEASIAEDPGTRDDIASAIPWFTGYWKSSDDPNFTLIRLDMKKILFDHHETSSKYTIEL